MIDTGGLAVLIQRGAVSMRRREMMEAAYDKRTGDEMRPLKGNYFCSYLKPQPFIMHFFCFCVSTEVTNNLQIA